MSDDGVCGRTDDGSVQCFAAATATTYEAPIGDGTSLTIAQTHACAVAQGKPVCWDLPSGASGPTFDSGDFTIEVVGAAASGGLIGTDRGGLIHGWWPDGGSVPMTPVYDFNAKWVTDVRFMAHDGRACIRRPIREYRRYHAPGVVDGPTPPWLEWCPDVPDPPEGFSFSASHRYGYCGVAQGGVHCWETRPVGETPSRPAWGWRQIAGAAPFVAMSAGQEHLCALDEAGAVSCWGTADDGRLGFVPNAPATLPIVTVAKDARALRMGWFDTCWVDADAELDCVREIGRKYVLSKWVSIRGEIPRGVLWDTRGVGQFIDRDRAVSGGLDLGSRRPRHGAVIEYSHDCVLHADRAVACGKELESEEGRVGVTGAPFRELRGAQTLQATDDEVCVLDDAGRVRCAPRWPDEQDDEYRRSWVGPVAVTVLEGVTEIAITGVGVCGLVGTRVSCTRDGSTSVDLPFVASTGIVAAGTTVCAHASTPVAHCIGNLDEVLDGHPPLVAGLEFSESIAELATDGLHVCARTTSGRVACAGWWDRVRFGQHHVRSPTDVTGCFVDGAGGCAG